MYNVMRAYNIYDPVDARRPRTRWLYYYCYIAIPSEFHRVSRYVLSGYWFPIRRFAMQWTHVAENQTIYLLCNMYYYYVWIRFVRIVLYDAQQLLRLGVYVYIDCIYYYRATTTRTTIYYHYGN